jgi:GTPase involved in cell partitioning and DNA repair
MQDLSERSNSIMAIVILANKADLKNLREVTKEDLDFIKSAYNVKYFEVSAFSGNCLKDAMKHMIETIIKLIDEYGRLT